MVWLGLLLIVAGALPALTLDGGLGGVELSVVGTVVMALGAVLVIAGVLRRRRRRHRSPGTVEPAYYRTSKGKIIAMVIAVVYILSPIDVIPDVFLPVGIVDDATALTWLLFAVGQEYTRRSEARRAR